MTRYSIELRYRIFVKGYRINSKVIQVTAGATGDLIGNKVTDKNTKISKTSLQNTSETVTSETEKKSTRCPEERYISPEQSRKLLMK